MNHAYSLYGKVYGKVGFLDLKKYSCRLDNVGKSTSPKMTPSRSPALPTMQDYGWHKVPDIQMVVSEARPLELSKMACRKPRWVLSMLSVLYSHSQKASTVQP